MIDFVNNICLENYRLLDDYSTHFPIIQYVLQKCEKSPQSWQIESKVVDSSVYPTDGKGDDDDNASSQNSPTKLVSMPKETSTTSDEKVTDDAAGPPTEPTAGSSSNSTK